MYHRFFGMQRKPFGISPDATAYCPLTGSEEALAALRFTIVQQSGIGLVTGDEGTGKTIVCMRLATVLDPTYAVALVTQTNFATVKAFYQALHYDLGLPYYGLDEQELRLSLSDFMLNRLVAGGRTVIIVDDAHNLPERALEELRLLSEAEAQGTRLASIVLAAHPRLHAKLNQPELRGLRQRIVAHAHLEPLGDLETATYIRHQIRRCGGEPERIITTEAIELIHEKTGGVPRLINRLCDHAFIVAFAAERPTVDRETVEAAWTDLVTYLPEEVAEPSSEEPVSEIEMISASETMASTGTPGFGAPTSEEICVASTQVTVSADTSTAAGEPEDVGEWVIEDRVAQLEAQLYEKTAIRTTGPSESAESPQAPGNPASDEESGEEWESVEIGPEQSDVPSLLNFVGRLDTTGTNQQSEEKPLVAEHGPHPTRKPHQPIRKDSPHQRRLFARLTEKSSTPEEPAD